MAARRSTSLRLALVATALTGVCWQSNFVGPIKSHARADTIMRREAPTVFDVATSIHTKRIDHPNSFPVQMIGPQFWDKLEKHDLQHILSSSAGLVQVLNFLPGVLASQTLARLESLNEHEWVRESNQGTIWHQALDSVASIFRGKGKTAEYSFDTYQGDAIAGSGAVIESMVGDCVINLKAARYQTSNHIAKHGDSGSTIAGLFTRTPLGKHIAPGTKLRRKFAFIWYLTRDWEEAYGGCLIDHGCGNTARTIVPQFNSAIIFEVPRDHEVTKMMEGSPSRYTVFGWFSTSD